MQQFKVLHSYLSFPPAGVHTGEIVPQLCTFNLMGRRGARDGRANIEVSLVCWRISPSYWFLHVASPPVTPGVLQSAPRHPAVLMSLTYLPDTTWDSVVSPVWLHLLFYPSLIAAVLAAIGSLASIPGTVLLVCLLRGGKQRLKNHFEYSSSWNQTRRCVVCGTVSLLGPPPVTYVLVLLLVKTGSSFIPTLQHRQYN